jgi:hypothetical protein
MVLHPTHPTDPEAVTEAVTAAAVITGETSRVMATAVVGVGMAVMAEVVAHMMTDLEAVVATETATTGGLAVTWTPSDLGKVVGIKVVGTTTGPQETTTLGNAPTTEEVTKILASCDATKRALSALWWVIKTTTLTLRQQLPSHPLHQRVRLLSLQHVTSALEAVWYIYAARRR